MTKNKLTFTENEGTLITSALLVTMGHLPRDTRTYQKLWEIMLKIQEQEIEEQDDAT